MQALACPLLLLAICSLAAPGCKKSDEATEATPKVADPAPAPAKPAEPTAAEVTLPPIDLAVAKASARERADQSNSAGLEKQKAGDYPEAIARYEEAVKADPSHLLARYNLATAHSKAGHREAALAILRELAAVPDCAVCQGRLVRATKDADFEVLWSDEDFVAVTGGAEVETLTAKQASKRLLRISAGFDKLPASLVHPRNPIKVRRVHGQCDPEPGDDCTSESVAIGFAALRELLDAPVILAADAQKCSGNCCEATATNDETGGDSALRIDKLCFATDSGGVTTLSEIDLTDAP